MIIAVLKSIGIDNQYNRGQYKNSASMRKDEVNSGQHINYSGHIVIALVLAQVINV